MKFRYIFIIGLFLGFVWGWTCVSLIKNFVVNPTTEEDSIPIEMKPTDIGCADCYYSIGGKVLFFPAWITSGGKTFMYGGPNATRTVEYIISGVAGSLVFGLLVVLWGLGRFRRHRRG